MQYKKILVLCLLSAFLLAGCTGNSDDGGDTPNQSQSCIDASGYWVIAYTLDQTNCGDMNPFEDEATSYKVIQTGCSITVYTTQGKFEGNINGSTITWSGKYYTGPLATGFDSKVTSIGGNFTGSSSWVLSDGYVSCWGNSQIAGTIYNRQE